MDREHDIVDLGAASTETQGNKSGLGDDVIGREPAGLSND